MENTVKTTGDQVKGMVDHVMANVPGPVGATFRSPNGGIPLQPEEGDYPLVEWWQEGIYKGIKNGNRPKDSDMTGPTMCLFMEDQNGNHISEGIRNSLRKDLFAYWTGVQRNGELLTTHSDTDLDRKEHFRETFETKYSWLRLCEGHWKVDRLWINYFSSWRRSHSPVTPTKIDQIHREQSLLLTSAVADKPHIAPMGSKRKLEVSGNSNEDPSKRLKLKGKVTVDIMQPTDFHHSKPKRKPVAKIAKVCNIPFCLSHIH
jgi:hypothetical protein